MYINIIIYTVYILFSIYIHLFRILWMDLPFALPAEQLVQNKESMTGNGLTPEVVSFAQKHGLAVTAQAKWVSLMTAYLRGIKEGMVKNCLGIGILHTWAREEEGVSVFNPVQSSRIRNILYILCYFCGQIRVQFDLSSRSPDRTCGSAWIHRLEDVRLNDGILRTWEASARLLRSTNGVLLVRKSFRSYSMLQSAALFGSFRFFNIWAVWSRHSRLTSQGQPGPTTCDGVCACYGGQSGTWIGSGWHGWEPRTWSVVKLVPFSFILILLNSGSFHCAFLWTEKNIYIYICIYIYCIYIADRLVWFMISQRDELRRWIFGTSSP